MISRTNTGELRKLFLDKFQFEPSEDQHSAINALCEFTLNNESRSLFILTGYAGTGKTTLLGSYVQTLNDTNIQTVLLAPTGRAAKVFSNRANKPAFTIHKKIYTPKRNDSGGIVLALGSNQNKNTVFIVDEASMIGDISMNDDGSIGGRSLLDDLLEYVFKSENCKLVFVGDEGQLPPVGLDYSPALNQDFLENNFFNLSIHTAKLNQVLRQSEGSDILRNANIIRNTAEGNIPQLNFKQKSDVQKISGFELQEELESSYSKYGSDETIVITKSNKRANLFNQQIRSRILWFEEDICRNDMLMVVKNNYFWIDPKSPIGFIANGEILQVIRISKREEKYGFHFAKATVQLVDYPNHGEFDTILLLDVLTLETPSLNRNELKTLFYEIEQEYLHEHNKKKRYELIMKNPYFNALQVKFAYAITCHKSQGGQWTSVFLDHGFIQEDQIDLSFTRWLYTGFTRAVEKLHLMNFDDRFFENDL